MRMIFKTAMIVSLALCFCPAATACTTDTPPVAVISGTWPQVITADDTIQFDGRSSVDVDTQTPTYNGITQYDWDFGDGSSHDNSAQPSHTFAAVADKAYFTITLTVQGDVEGVYGSITCKVYVKTATPTTWYVSKFGNDSSNDGKSWKNSFVSLDKALLNARPDDQIWVAKGIYSPGVDSRTIPGNPRSATFQGGHCVSVYGGFAGEVTETSTSGRDFLLNATVLSGDLGNNDPAITDNSYRVLSLYRPTRIDGFTITGGNANITGYDTGGGYCGRGDIANCIFRNNYADKGGALYPIDSVTDCRFENNSAKHGGAIYNWATPTITRCVFSNNTSTVGSGGAIWNCAGTITLTDCQIVGSTSAQWGGGLFSSGGSLNVNNCMFMANTAYCGGAIEDRDGCQTTLKGCTVVGNHSSTPGYNGTYAAGGFENDVYSTATVENCIFWSNTDITGLPTEAAQLRNAGTSMTVRYNCISGLNIYAGNGNIGSDPLLVNANTGDVHLLTSPSLSPCINAGNTADGPMYCYTTLVSGAQDADRRDMGYHYWIYTDSDGDGLSDQVDPAINTADADSDGIVDGWEVANGLSPTNPNDAQTDCGDGTGRTWLEKFRSEDSDGDGMSNGWEKDNGRKVYGDDSQNDPDGDGFTNLYECQNGMDPLVSDSVARLVTVTEHEYDADGTLISVSTSDLSGIAKSVTEYAYDLAGRKTLERRRFAPTCANANDAADSLSIFLYDRAGNITWRIQKMGFNSDLTTAEPGDIATEMAYDNAGMLQYEYRKINGNVASQVGLRTEYLYHQTAGLPTGWWSNEAIDPELKTSRRIYDASDRFVKEVDTGDSYRELSYDSRGQTLKEVYYDSSATPLMQTRAAYNGIGREIMRATMANASSSASIDKNVDSVTERQYANGTGLLESTTKYYGKTAAISGSATRAAKITQDYDSLGRLIRVDTLGDVVSHWSFDDGSATDSTGVNNGTVYSGTSAVGAFGGALVFNGSSSYVDCGTGASLGVTKMTISAWVCLDRCSTDASIGQVIASSYDGSGAGYILFLRGNAGGTVAYPGLRLYGATTNGEAVDTASLELDKWYHITGTYDGGTLRVFVDGTLKASASFSGAVGANRLCIGKAAWASSNYFTGRIDNVVLCNHAIPTSTEYTYDTSDRVTRRQEISANEAAGGELVLTTDYVYNTQGGVYKQIAKGNIADSYTWQTTRKYNDARGLLIREVNPAGVAAVQAYDSFGNLISKVADFGGIAQTTRYTWDRGGRQKTIRGYVETGSVPQVTTYAVDEVGRVTNILYPDAKNMAFTYGDGGKVHERTAKDGTTKTVYMYDNAYNLTAKTVTYGTDTTPVATETFGYDGLGRLKSAKKVAGGQDISETSLWYTGLGTLDHVTDDYYGTSSPAARTITYGNDQAGNRTSMTYPSNIVLYTAPQYDGRIDQLYLGTTQVASYDYVGSRVANRRSTVYSASGAINYFAQYDGLGRLSGISNRRDDGTTLIAGFAYEYKPNTNDISKQTYTHRSGSPFTAFSYDNLDRLTEAQYGISSQSEEFTMDDLGNRESVKEKSSSTTDYTVQPLTNRYSQVGTAVPVYDAAGNMTHDEKGYDYDYDYENRIVKVWKNNRSTAVAEFDYDALGRRIKKVDSITAANCRYFYYTDKWQVAAEYYGTSLTANYAYGNDDDEVLFRMPSGVTFMRQSYAHDHLYSPVVHFNYAGAVNDRYEYDAYGKATIYDASYQTRIVPSLANRYLFTGREVDYLDNGNLSLQYNRHRYYSQSLGRWTSEDPLGIDPAGKLTRNLFGVDEQYRDGMSSYEYALSAPVQVSDPSGMGCRVYYDCVLTGQKANGWFNPVKHCYYACAESVHNRRESMAEGSMECDDPRIPGVIQMSTMIPRCSKCERTISDIRQYDEYPGDPKNCSKKDCLQNAKNLGRAMRISCRAISDPRERAACQVLAHAIQTAYEAACDLCTRP